MQFGIVLPTYLGAAAAHNIAHAAKKAEELGFDSAWSTDHIIICNPYVSNFGPTIYEAYTVLAYVAAITRRIRLGVSVIVVPYRNPIVQAKVLSTLDQLSNGRIILATGVGWADLEFDALGVPFEERGDRTDEYLAIMRTLWTEEEPHFDGKFFSFGDLAFEPKPVQRPHIPMWIGGSSMRAARRAVKFGETWHPSRASLPEITERLRYIEKISEEQGREKPPGLTARMVLHPISSTATVPHRYWHHGVEETIMPQGKRPLGTGTMEEIAEDIHALRELGCSHLAIDFRPESAIQLWESMDMFAAELMPLFKP